MFLFRTWQHPIRIFIIAIGKQIIFSWKRTPTIDTAYPGRKSINIHIDFYRWFKKTNMFLTGFFVES